MVSSANDVNVRHGLAAAYREGQCCRYNAAARITRLQYSSPCIPAAARSACGSRNSNDASGRNRGRIGNWKRGGDCLREGSSEMVGEGTFYVYLKCDESVRMYFIHSVMHRAFIHFEEMPEPLWSS